MPCYTAGVKPITLRNLPPDVARLIRQQAKAHKTSLNRTVIALLERSAAGPAKTSATILHHDLDHLAGSWSAEESAAFDDALASQRQIETDLWK
jgi:hypothetical protein